MSQKSQVTGHKPEVAPKRGASDMRFVAKQPQSLPESGSGAQRLGYVDGGPKRVGDFLQGILRGANPRKRGGLAELTEAWSRAAGPEVARRTRLVSFTRDVLTVSVESAALRQEIETFRKEQILERMNLEFPAKRIAALKCVLGSR